MSDTELCQALMCSIAGTGCSATWGVSAIHPAGLLLLWDDRAGAAREVLEAIAAEAGELLAACGTEWGPHARPMIGALVRPHGGELAEAAANLQAAYEHAARASDAGMI